MKNLRYLYSAAMLIILAVLATPSVAQSDNQSLGEYARTIKKPKSEAKSSSKVYDNDNLPGGGTISVVGSTGSDPGAAAAKSEDQGADKSDAKSTEPQLKAGQSAQERQKALDAWKGRLDEQKDKITAISHELDLLQREYRLNASEFYANTANRVQHPYGFAQDDAKYKQQIADKQKELEDAQAKLADMQDTARKAGAPNSVSE
ncbi:MAG: hypothetical protein JO356_15020 [Acidobacteria bacterium]|nr:hypothetical protein [Acidobacteriota bacterium]